MGAGTAADGAGAAGAGGALGGAAWVALPLGAGVVPVGVSPGCMKRMTAMARPAAATMPPISTPLLTPRRSLRSEGSGAALGFASARGSAARAATGLGRAGSTARGAETGAAADAVIGAAVGAVLGAATGVASAASLLLASGAGRRSRSSPRGPPRRLLRREPWCAAPAVASREGSIGAAALEGSVSVSTEGTALVSAVAGSARGASTGFAGATGSAAAARGASVQIGRAHV